MCSFRCNAYKAGCCLCLIAEHDHIELDESRFFRLTFNVQTCINSVLSLMKIFLFTLQHLMKYGSLPEFPQFAPDGPAELLAPCESQVETYELPTWCKVSVLDVSLSLVAH